MAIKITLMAIDKVTRTLGGIGKKVGGLGIKFAKFGAIAGAAVAGISLKLHSELEKGLTEVTTLMGDVSKDTIPNMRKELQGLAMASGQAIAPLVKAKYDIVSAGFSQTKKAIGEASEAAVLLQASTELAVGGVTTTAKAADLLTTALNAYGLEATDVRKVSDVMFQTVKKGKTTMDELAEGMGNVLPFARAAGWSLADVGAAMATTTAAGINTAMSTTALKGAIMALSAPSKGAAKAMAEAGIGIKKNADGMVDLAATIKQFEGMDPQTMKKFIPNIRAGAAIISMANNYEKLEGNIKSFTEMGEETTKAYDKMTNTFSFQMGRLKESGKVAFQEIGMHLATVITPAIEGLNKTLSRIGDIGWGEVGKRIFTNLDALRLLIRKLAMLAFKAFVLAAEVGLKKLPTVIYEGMKDSIKLIKEFGTFIGEPLVKGFKLAGLNIKKFFVGLGKDIEAVFNDMVNKIIDSLNKVIKAFNKVSPKDISLIDPVKSVPKDEVLAKIDETIAQVKSKTTAFEAFVNKDDKQTAIDLLNETKAAFGEYQDAILGAQDETNESLKLKSKDISYNFGPNPTDVIPVVELTAGEIENRQKELTTKLDEISKGSFQDELARILDAEARFNEANLSGLDVTKYVEDAKQALYTKTAQSFSGTMASNLATMAKSGMIGGKSAKRFAQVQALVDSYASANAAYKAMAGIPVIGPALAIAAAGTALGAGLANVRMIEKQKFALGGLVQGRGGMDNVPASLTSGEYVMQKSAVDNIGIGQLDAMNQGAGGGQTINIQTFDSAGLENYVRMNPEEFARAFKYAQGSGYLE